MANTYKWDIASVDCHVNKDGLENVIYQVHYRYIAEDENGNKAFHIGIHQVSDPDPASFTPFDDLRAADVISWLENDLELLPMQNNLNQQIQEIVNPTQVNKRLLIDSEESLATEESTEETV